MRGLITFGLIVVILLCPIFCFADSITDALSKREAYQNYLLKDGSNDPTTGIIDFGDDIRGPEAGCIVGSTLFINSGPAHCSAAKCGVDLNAGFNALGGCPGGDTALLIFTEDMDATYVEICSSVLAPVDIAAAFNITPGRFVSGVDDVRLCIVDVGGGPGPYVSAIIPSSDSCATLVANFGLAPGALITEDADYFSANAITCTYDFTPDAGLSLISGWPSPTITTDYAWVLSDTGDLTLVGDLSNNRPGGDLDWYGKANFGSLGSALGATLTNYVLSEGEEFDETSGIIAGLNFFARANPTGASSALYYGVYGAIEAIGSYDFSGSLSGIFADVLISNESDITLAAGLFPRMTLSRTGNKTLSSWNSVYPAIADEGFGARSLDIGQWVDYTGTVLSAKGPNITISGDYYGVYIVDNSPYVSGDAWGIYNLGRSYVSGKYTEDTTDYPSIQFDDLLDGGTKFITSDSDGNIYQKNIGDIYSYTIVGNHAILSPIDGDTDYWGNFYSLAPSGVSKRRKMYVPKSGRIVGVDVNTRAGSIVTATEDTVLTLRLNDTTDVAVLSTTIKYTNIEGQNILVSGLDIDVVAGDFLEFRFDFPTWTGTNPTSITSTGIIYIQE